MHRYAADAFVLLVFWHLYKEIRTKHFRGPRLFSWLSGVPLLVLVYASGIVGYWSIAFLLRYLKTYSTYLFIIYRLLVGGLILFAHL